MSDKPKYISRYDTSAPLLTRWRRRLFGLNEDEVAQNYAYMEWMQRKAHTLPLRNDTDETLYVRTKKCSPEEICKDEDGMTQGCPNCLPAMSVYPWHKK